MADHGLNVLAFGGRRQPRRLLLQHGFRLSQEIRHCLVAIPWPCEAWNRGLGGRQLDGGDFGSRLPFREPPEYLLSRLAVK
jgi:hypothetical protein